VYKVRSLVADLATAIEIERHVAQIAPTDLDSQRACARAVRLLRAEVAEGRQEALASTLRIATPQRSSTRVGD